MAAFALNGARPGETRAEKPELVAGRARKVLVDGGQCWGAGVSGRRKAGMAEGEKMLRSAG